MKIEVSKEKVCIIYRDYDDFSRGCRSYLFTTVPPLEGAICGGGSMSMPSVLIEDARRARDKGYEIKFAKDSTFPGMSMSNRMSVKYPLNPEDEALVRRELVL